jgi:hypothetical protein
VPILLLLLVVLGVTVAVLLLIPVSLALRYRAGKARRPARGWVARFNIAGLLVSCVMYAITAGIVSFWTPGTLTYALAGLLTGALLGGAGLALTRWEPTGDTLYFTPNAAIVLIVTLIVAIRIAYAAWRVWHAWEVGSHAMGVAEGVRESLAVTGTVLGYYLTYWAGVLRRIRSSRLGVVG